jgi:hypothetical protein
VVGQQATFLITARDEHNNPRLSGGDVFSVLLLPQTTSSIASGRSPYTTGPAGPLPGGHAEQRDNAACVAAPVSASGTGEGGGGGGGGGAASSVIWRGTPVPHSMIGGSPGSNLMEWERMCGRAEQHQVLVVSAVAAGEVQDHGDGSYSCSYTHTTAGLYDLHVVNGEHCPPCNTGQAEHRHPHCKHGHLC